MKLKSKIEMVQESSANSINKNMSAIKKESKGVLLWLHSSNTKPMALGWEHLH